MSLTTNAHMLALARTGGGFRASSTSDGSFWCPVCCDVIATPDNPEFDCPHMLAFRCVGAEWVATDWWQPSETDGDEFPEVELKHWEFLPKKVPRAGWAKFLTSRKWVPVLFSISDHRAWFAVPEAKLKGKTPKAAFAALVKKVEKAIAAAEKEEAEGRNEDDS